MAGQANDSERLPWLEPYREPGAKSPRLKAVANPHERVPTASDEGSKIPSRGVPVAAWLMTGVVVVALAAGGGYWVGNRDGATEPTAARTVTIPVAKVDPIPMPDVEPAPLPAAPSATAVPPAPKRTSSTPKRAAKPRTLTTPRRSTTASPPPRPDAAPPAPKVMSFRAATPTAGPPGTVVDLGRYWSPTLAARAYRTTVGRYPALAKLKKVVAPEPVVYGEPRLYTLQLGARSASEARQYCDNLKKIGRPCLVR